MALLAPARPALAAFLLLGAFTYVVIYTLWLKPRSPLNIVIGGAAGSFAVLSGGAALGKWADLGVRAAVRWMLAHSLAVAVLGLLLATRPALGAGCLLIAGPAGLELVRRNAVLLRRPSPAG